jgi:cytochrome d ubiquinol oxidase subunit I
VEGLSEVQASYEKTYGKGEYVPNVFVQYWSMRVMAYAGSLLPLLAIWGIWRMRRNRLSHKRLGNDRISKSRFFLFVATWAVLAPFVINTAGWMLTENGRQPWLVQGLMLTEDGVSPTTGTGELVTSLVVFGLIYLTLGVVAVRLMLRYARRDLAWTDSLRRPDPEPEEPVGTAVPTSTGEGGTR